MKKENRLNKKEVARRMSACGGVTIVQAEHCLDLLVRIFRETMESGGTITLQHMGTFSVTEHSERRVYVPSTGRMTRLQARKKVKFTPSATLRLASSCKEE